MAWKALTNGAPLSISSWCGTRPITAAVTRTYNRAQAAVPSTEARPDVAPRVLDPSGGDRRHLHADEREERHTRGDSDAAVETPPDALKGPKFAERTKNQPTMPTTASGRNFKTTDTFWNSAIRRIPARLTAAGIHRPHTAMPKLVHAVGREMENSDST